MLFSKTILQKRIANGAREGNINDAIRVHVPYFRFPKHEFPAPEAVRMDRNMRPSQDFPLKLIELRLHHHGHLIVSHFDVQMLPLDSGILLTGLRDVQAHADRLPSLCAILASTKPKP